MATEIDVDDLPNIKICIDNDEVSSEIEEGEVTSDEEKEVKRVLPTKVAKPVRKPAEIKRDLPSPYQSDDEKPLFSGLADLESFGVSKQKVSKLPSSQSSGQFVLGYDPTSKEIQEKRGLRAKRFGLSEENTQIVDQESFEQLYKSLDLEAEALAENDESKVRAEALSLYGVREMSNDDILQYFHGFNPLRVERINDRRCNVVWMDKLSACRAILELSTDLSVLFQENKEEQKKEKKEKSSEDDSDDELNLLSSDEEEELRAKGELKDSKQTSSARKPIEPPPLGGRSLEDIKRKMPRGTWRLGKVDPRAKFLFIKFANKRPPAVEYGYKPARYQRRPYTRQLPKKLPPRGLISRSMRKRMEEDNNTYIAMESDFDRELRKATERLSQKKEKEGSESDRSMPSDVEKPKREDEESSSEEEEEMDMERELNHLLQAIPEQRMMRMHADDEMNNIRAKQLASEAQRATKENLDQRLDRGHASHDREREARSRGVGDGVTDLRSRLSARNTTQLGKRHRPQRKRSPSSSSSSSSESDSSDEPDFKYEKLTIQVDPDDI